MPKLYEATRLGFCCNDKKIWQDPFSVVSRLFCGHVTRDRFGFLNKYSPYNLAGDVDKIDQDVLPNDMWELCSMEAQRYINSGKHIYVLWSGGIDSTAIVVAFLMCNVDLKNFTVVYNSHSVEENKEFFELMRNKGVDLQKQESIPDFVDTVSDCIVITGRCADQLFGSDVHLKNPTVYNKPWLDGLRELMAQSGVYLSANSYALIERVYTEYASLLGLDLEQFCEFAWLFNFGAKWEYSAETFPLMCTNKASRSCIRNFFDTPEFQVWAIRNFPKLREHNPWLDPYWQKKELKDFIYEYDKNEDYLRNKQKIQSKWGRRTNPSDKPFISVKDSDGYHVFTVKGSAYPDPHELQRIVRNRYLKEEFQE